MYPPVNTTFYHPDSTAPGGHFLIVSALVPYKRIELAIGAARLTGATLRIVGDGPDRQTLERMAGPGIEFTGRLSDEAVRDEYRRALAVILPGEEDFGIAPLEAQACGRPVIALARGGALETGVLVGDDTPEAFAAAFERAGRTQFESARIRRHAERFSTERFVRDFQAALDETLAAPAGTQW